MRHKYLAREYSFRHNLKQLKLKPKSWNRRNKRSFKERTSEEGWNGELLLLLLLILNTFGAAWAHVADLCGLSSRQLASHFNQGPGIAIDQLDRSPCLDRSIDQGHHIVDRSRASHHRWSMAIPVFNISLAFKSAIAWGPSTCGNEELKAEGWGSIKDLCGKPAAAY